ncbi:MAG: NusA-like transcription termination signal-binding factor [Candidatus Aenigmatarchaeota archaeon]|nr:NusA-like transcription termination signal-binding factor [Candidatus Aenigmarchaeota archaeon]
MRVLDSEKIRMITTFETITGTSVHDCVYSPETKTIFFIVEEGLLGKAIGKNGQNINIAKKMLKKNIILFEWSSEINKFIKNLIPEAKSIKFVGDSVLISVDAKLKPMVIGKGGSKLKVIREILERNANISEVRIV